MLRFPTRASLAATVSAVALMAAASASAQQYYQFGGGGTLAASTHSQVLNALDAVQGASPNPIYCGGTWPPSGTSDTVCNQYGYIGSGLGFAALAADSANPANNVCTTGANATLCPVLNVGVSVGKIEYYANTNGVPVGFDNIISFASSDSQLSAAQLAIWTTGTGSQSGITFSLPTPQAAKAGPLLQLPAFGTPITIPAHFTPGALNKNGTITLTDAQICGIFNGSITSTTDKHLTGGAGDNVNYPNAYGSTTPSSHALTVVYRSDSSGTTFLFTQHLAAVCGSLPAPANAVTFTATQAFASVFGVNGNPPFPTSGFTGASGSAAVEAAINNTTYSFGYLSPDYTKIAPRNAPYAFPAVASVTNRHNGVTYAPSGTATTAALATVAYNPTTDLNANLAYPPTDPAAVRSWVPTVADPAVGYPIVGYTNIFFPQCFGDTVAGNGVGNVKAGALIAFLSALQPTGGFANQIEQGGFVTVSNDITNFISNNILNNSAYNLDLQNASLCESNGGTVYAGRGAPGAD